MAENWQRMGWMEASSLRLFLKLWLEELSSPKEEVGSLFTEQGFGSLVLQLMATIVVVLRMKITTITIMMGEDRG